MRVFGVSRRDDAVAVEAGDTSFVDDELICLAGGRTVVSGPSCCSTLPVEKVNNTKSPRLTRVTLGRQILGKLPTNAESSL